MFADETDELLDDLRAEKARLKKALRECVGIVEANQYLQQPGRVTATCKGCAVKCGTTHKDYCSYNNAIRKAREALGDA